MTASDSARSAGPGVGAAIVAMLAAMTLLPVVDALSKLMTDGYSPAQITFGRNLAHVAVVAPLALAIDGGAALRPPALGLQLVRCALMALCTIFFVAALKRLPQAEALATVFLFPCLVTAFSPLVLGERVGPRRWAAVAVGFLGAAIVINPESASLNVGSLYALAAAFAYAGYVLLTRKLSASAPPLTMLLLMGAVGVVIAGALAVDDWRPPTDAAIGVMALIGVLAAIVHLLVILSYRWGEASLISPFGYFQIVGGAALGYAMFGDVPTLQDGIGVALIISSGLYIAWRESLRRPPA